MRLHRFFISFNYTDPEIKLRDANLIRQIQKVFRMKKGDHFILCDGLLNEATAEIAEIGKDELRAKILERNKNENELNARVMLYCSILKREHFEMVVEKAVECGVSEIIPIITQRTLKFGLNLGRLQKIAKEAAEQSGRGVIPLVRSISFFEKALSDAAQNDYNILFDFGGGEFKNIKEKIQNSAGIFIGPEGGFAREEIELAKRADIYITALGKLTLRAETAAIVGTYLIVQR